MVQTVVKWKIIKVNESETDSFGNKRFKSVEFHLALT